MCFINGETKSLITLLLPMFISVRTLISGFIFLVVEFLIIKVFIDVVVGKLGTLLSILLLPFIIILVLIVGIIVVAPLSLLLAAATYFIVYYIIRHFMFSLKKQ